jgi:uncharacterized protein
LLRILTFFTVATIILAIGYGYVGWRLIPSPRIQRGWKLATWIVLAILSVLPSVVMVLQMGGGGSIWSDVLAWIAFLGLAVLSIAFALFLTRDGIRALAWVVALAVSRVRGLIAPSSEEADSDAPQDPDRRGFLESSVNWSLVGLSGAMAGYGLFEAHLSPEVVDVSVPIDGLPPDLEGFRIVQISDLHVGATIKGDWVSDVVDAVNALSPDIVALTGDLVDGRVVGLEKDVAPLARLSPRHASYFVTGNHEYYSGAQQWITEVRRLGFDALLNEHRIIRQGEASILLGGVTDPAGRQFGHTSSARTSLAGARRASATPADVKILLAHQPKSVFDAAEAGYDLQICGHTHGGQFFPWSYVVYLMQPFVAGLHRYERTWIYVNRGTGYWGPPVRIGRPPEITAIELHATHLSDEA